MDDRTVGGYHVPASEAGTQRAQIVEQRLQAEAERQRQLDEEASRRAWAEAEAHNRQRAQRERDQRQRQAQRRSKKQQPAKGRRTTPASSDSGDFSVLFAVIGFFVALGGLYDPTLEDNVAAYIGSAIAGVLVGRLYKVIIGVGLLILVLYVLGSASG